MTTLIMICYTLYMIGYKFVIKGRNNCFRSLVKYGIDNSKRVKVCSYKKNVIYCDSKKLYEFSEQHGYHFFTEPFPKTYGCINRESIFNMNVKESFEKYFRKIHKRPIKITVVKCEIYDIIAIKNNRILAKSFKILDKV